MVKIIQLCQLCSPGAQTGGVHSLAHGQMLGSAMWRGIVTPAARIFMDGATGNRSAG